MKKVLISLAILIILIVCIIALVIGLNYKNNDNILKSEEKQVDFLYDLYMDTVSHAVLNSEDVVLDKTAIRNFVTGEEFSEESISKLKSVEVTNADSDVTITLAIKFNSNNNSLTYTVTEKNGMDITVLPTKYMLTVKDGKITYNEKF